MLSRRGSPARRADMRATSRGGIVAGYHQPDEAVLDGPQGRSTGVPVMRAATSRRESCVAACRRAWHCSTSAASPRGCRAPRHTQAYPARSPLALLPHYASTASKRVSRCLSSSSKACVPRPARDPSRDPAGAPCPARRRSSSSACRGPAACRRLVAPLRWRLRGSEAPAAAAAVACAAAAAWHVLHRLLVLQAREAS